MYDEYTGVIIKQSELEIEMNLDQMRVLENGAFVIYTNWMNTFVYLNRELEVTFNSVEENLLYSSMMPSNSGTSFYYTDIERKHLYSYDMASKTATGHMTLEEELLDLSLEGITAGDGFILAYYYGDIGLGYMLIDLNEGTCHYFEPSDSLVIERDTVLMFNDYDRISNGYFETFYVENPRIVHKHYLKEKDELQHYNIDATQDLIVTVNDYCDNDQVNDAIVFRS